MIVSKNELMNKSIELFKTHGYENVTVPMICQQFGVTKGSFYHHFKSKNDLLLQWMVKEYSIIESGYYHDNSLSEYENFRNKQMIWAKFLEFLDRDLSFATLKIMIQYLNAPEQFSKFEISSLRSLDVDYVKKLQSQGIISSLYKAEELIRIYSEMVVGATIEWQTKNNDYNILERIEFIFDFVYKKR